MTTAKEQLTSRYGTPEQFTLAAFDFLIVIGIPHPLWIAKP